MLAQLDAENDDAMTLQELAGAIAEAKDGRPAYDRLMKTFKALKKEVDAVVGEV